jgi:hypothetical protein
MKKEISQIIQKVGGLGINVIQDAGETTFTFNKTISNKEFTFILFSVQEDNMLVINLLHAYSTQYNNMEADFYEVINKLNGTCIHGYLGFLKEEKTQIAYKSSYIGDAANLEGNKSFEYFFQVSFDMVDYFHSQLN